MVISPAIDAAAERIPDEIRKLRYLRNELPDTVLPPERISRQSLTGIVLVGLAFAALQAGVSHPRPQVHVARTFTPAPEPAKTWLVEQHDSYAVYSNGLQVRLDYLTTSAPRSYRAFSRAGLQPSQERTSPAGIIYHTTESLQLPLEPGRTRSLIRTREGLLGFVRSNRLYNYVIGRFGQVFRVVPEDQVAYHAGHSVWANAKEVYEGLNDSFLGIAFEAATATSFVPDAAQIRAGRLLTDMLRSQYGIPESNCATHAQVSVNPSNMRIGYHTDWAANFPFREFGFQLGYATPVASIELFGFAYDRTFLEAIGGQPWAGLIEAEDHVRRDAAARGLKPEAYRRILQRQYFALKDQLALRASSGPSGSL
jgi:hypothetical protein